MHFKKLEVFGFKSFADKLNLEFEDGITAIVGPNGCGKSNVADSIRWALGEQSAKSLRGSQMQDVIFSGTDARKSLSFCEVSLHFDNTERIFESEFNDVVISRKLYRSGDSEYMINKNAVRYKDIGAILHNTGLGKNSYSIIGQGRIDSILSAKPGDRRGIFEDAAGISKYKEAKIENERKLARVAEKLDRSGDIIAELEKQLDPLRKQAEDARRCFEVQEKLKYYDVNNYIVQYESVQDKRDEINLRLQAIDEEYDLKQDEYNAASDEYQAIMDGFDSLDVEMSKLNDERLELNLSLEKQASEIKILKEKINHLKEQNDRMRGEVAKFNGEYEEDNRKLAGLSASRIDKSALADTLKIDIDGVSTRYLEVVQILARNEDEVERAHREVITSMSRLSEAKSELSRLSAEKDSVAERLEDYDRRIDVILNKISEDQKKAERIKADVDTFFAGRQKAFDAGAQKAALYERTNQQIRELALDIDKLSAEYHSKQSRAKLLDELHKEMQGYSYSVKAVLKEASVNKKIAACVEGVLAQLIKVKAEHETAIEMVLGGALQNIITNTEEDAKFIIEFLKQNRFGRATFLPISSVKSRVLDQGSAKYLSIRGVIGVASELIEYDRKYKDIIENLLGRTVVVDTMDTAIYVARESKYAFRIVTLDGDIISPQGSITGGSKKSEI
ncbi:MAG: chromosome segregation protein SMC, partial [Clostridiales bacterium]|nr:chromosome segregation protein SMC [Clostridiales bacterium]